jgi:hypothetical protein
VKDCHRHIYGVERVAALNSLPDQSWPVEGEIRSAGRILRTNHLKCWLTLKSDCPDFRTEQEKFQNKGDDFYYGDHNFQGF